MTSRPRCCPVLARSALPGTLARPAWCVLSGQVCTLVTKTHVGNKIKMGSVSVTKRFFLRAASKRLSLKGCGLAGLSQPDL